MKRKELAKLYNMDYSTFWGYLKKYRGKLDRLATRIHFRGRQVIRKKLNRKQINFIVKHIMQDPPEGYKNVNGLLLKFEE
jgi:hypothetical protein